MSEQIVMTITQTTDYKFEVDFGEMFAPIMADLPPPLGENAGPTPEHFLLAAVANCLSASLLFALRKFKQNADAMKTTISCTIDRNDNKRMRVTHIHATLNLGKEAQQFENLDRILAQFEDFCTVSQSVQTGIPITIRVEDSTGAVLG